jgi:hypothetical protein
MRRTLLGIAIASALVAVPAVASAGAAGGPTATASATTCHLTAHEERSLGASYVTSLKVDKTTCAKGKSVTLAFNKCRTSGGKPQGYCKRKVAGYNCAEHRYDAVPHVQYSSTVTCTSSDKRIISTYTENT